MIKQVGFDKRVCKVESQMAFAGGQQECYHFSVDFKINVTQTIEFFEYFQIFLMRNSINAI